MRVVRNFSHHHHCPAQTYTTTLITTISLISLINCIFTECSSNNPHISIKRNFQEYKLSPQRVFHLFILTTAALCGTVLGKLTFNISLFFFFGRGSAAAVLCAKALPTVCTVLGNSVAWESAFGVQNRRGVEVEECTVGGMGEETRKGRGRGARMKEAIHGS